MAGDKPENTGVLCLIGEEFMVCFPSAEYQRPPFSVVIRGCLVVPGPPGVLCLFKAIYRLWTAY